MKSLERIFLRSSSAVGLLLGLGGCVEPYMPDVINAPNKYLVVDGFINGNGATRIKLSRTENIATSTAPPVEKGATIFIVDNSGARYAVREVSPGFYKSDSMVLNPARQYQLRIATAGSSAANYESDLVALKVTPPIDKVDWVQQGGELQLRVSTHDAQAQSRYYRWSFTETWEFNSAYESKIELIRSIIQPRVTPIYRCWHTEANTAIHQSSSAQLSQDAITNLLLLRFSDRAERLKIRYSLFVTQYAETPAEFAYLEILRKNTEAVGGVNDPLPSQLTGNVHRVGTATNEPVLGFVGAHTMQQTRIFLTPQILNLPAGWAFEDPYSACNIGQELVPDPGDKYPIYIPNTRIFLDPGNVPIDYITGPGGTPTGYTGSSRACVDCRTRGVNMKPSFW
ncbi:MAG: DUF4249 domain-containing protein [Hymenobacter sp.]|nr:MAG: DUF4249 domain-containing protein [Hymenobacter sp.]